MQGMDLIRKERGMMAKIAAQLGLTRAAVTTWRKVPAARVQRVAEITGIPAAQLRPDIFEPPASPGRAA